MGCGQRQGISRLLRKIPLPDFAGPNEPHALLADLNLPLYITTNYDHFMAEAIRHGAAASTTLSMRVGIRISADPRKMPLPRRSPNPVARNRSSSTCTASTVSRSPSSSRRSDYLDFLINLGSEPKLLPSVVRSALANTVLLFIGYSLNDWNFRVLTRAIHRSIPRNLKYSSIAVQLPPEDRSTKQLRLLNDYISQYFAVIQANEVKVYWGNVQDFTAKLKSAMEQSGG